jgi:hypothetical protein
VILRSAREVAFLGKFPAGGVTQEQITENPCELNRSMQHHLTEIICY